MLTSKDNDKHRKGLIAALLIVCPIVVFCRVAFFDFVSWDDGAFVYENPSLSPVTGRSILSFWQRPFNYLYAPVPYTVWGALALAGPGKSQSMYTDRFNPALYHVVNLLCHVLCVLFVYALLRRLVRSRWAACAGALLFALHPLQIASVAWVSQLKGVMAGMFSAAALWLYVASAERNTGRDWKKPAQYAAATILFALGMLSKPSAIVLPLAALAIDKWCLDRPWKPALIRAAPWFAIAVPFAVVARIAQILGPVSSANALWFRPFIALDALWFYAQKAVLPVRLCMDYGRSPAYLMSQGWPDLLWIVPATVLTVLVLWKSRNRLLWTSVTIFAAMLLPVLGLTPFQFQSFSTTDDRYVYAALLGPALAFSHLLDARGSRAVWVVGASLLVVLAVRSVDQLGIWRNDVALYEHTLGINPKSARAHNNLGQYYYNVKKNLPLAEKHFLQSLRFDPNDATALANLGFLRRRQGRLDEAIALYAQSLLMRPGDSQTRLCLGTLLTQKGDLLDAIDILKSALSLAPDCREAHSQLALAFFMHKNFTSAIDQYTRALSSAPQDTAVLVKRGIAYALADSLDQALSDFQRVCTVDPSRTDARNYAEQIRARKRTVGSHTF